MTNSTTSEPTKGRMARLIDFLTRVLTPVSEKMMGIDFLAALSSTMQAVLPIILIGSFALLLANLQIGGYQDLVSGIPGFLAICNGIFNVTVGLFSLYVMIVLTYMYGTKRNMREAVATVPVVLMVFMLLTPLQTSKTGTLIPMDWLGTKGLFSAFVLSWAVPRAVQFLIARNIRIRMPAGVPRFVEDGFAVLVPGLILAAVAGVVATLLAGTPLQTFHNIIYTVLQEPLKAVGLSLPGHILIYTLAALVMFLGIHAGTIGYLIVPLAIAADLENLQAYQAGEPLPNIITQAFSNLTLPGQAGALLIPAIIMVFFCRSKRYKSIGRLSIVPAIFGIGEPVLFGVPVMLNPVLLIPMLSTVILNNLIAYAAIATGIIGRFTGVSLPWTTPPIVYPLLASSTPIQAAVFNLLLIVFDILIWLPFMRVLDRTEVQKELAAATEELSASQARSTETARVQRRAGDAGEPQIG